MNPAEHSRRQLNASSQGPTDLPARVAMDPRTLHLRPDRPVLLLAV